MQQPSIPGIESNYQPAPMQYMQMQMNQQGYTPIINQVEAEMATLKSILAENQFIEIRAKREKPLSKNENREYIIVAKPSPNDPGFKAFEIVKTVDCCCLGYINDGCICQGVSIRMRNMLALGVCSMSIEKSMQCGCCKWFIDAEYFPILSEGFNWGNIGKLKEKRNERSITATRNDDSIALTVKPNTNTLMMVTYRGEFPLARLSIDPKLDPLADETSGDMLVVDLSLFETIEDRILALSTVLLNEVLFEILTVRL